MADSKLFHCVYPLPKQTLMSYPSLVLESLEETDINKAVWILLGEKLSVPHNTIINTNDKISKMQKSIWQNRGSRSSYTEKKLKKRKLHKYTPILSLMRQNIMRIYKLVSCNSWYLYIHIKIKTAVRFISKGYQWLSLGKGDWGYVKCVTKFSCMMMDGK